MGAATVLEILAATPPIKKLVNHPEVDAADEGFVVDMLTASVAKANRGHGGRVIYTMHGATWD